MSLLYASSDLANQSNMLILIAGLPGSGKTTIAAELALRIGAAHYNSDKIRLKLNLQGQYTAEAKQQVYEALQMAIKKHLSEQPSGFVIADSTFLRASLREAFEQVARGCGSPFHWTWVYASEEASLERVRRKRLYSEAGPEEYQRLKQTLEPPFGEYLHLRTDILSVKLCVDQIVHSIDALLHFPSHD